MNNLKLIAAIGKNNELGKDNKLLWHIPEDLKFFKEQTLNKNIIMGINTYYSLPNKLPNRNYIVLTHKDTFLGKDILVLKDLKQLLEYISSKKEDFYCIGGASIYKQLIEYVSVMYLTKIDKEYVADTYFPIFNEKDFTKEELTSLSYKDINYKRYIYKRNLNSTKKT